MNAMHIHISGTKLQVMILVDGIYEEHLYDNWRQLFAAHPIMLTAKGVHVFVRG